MYTLAILEQKDTIRGIFYRCDRELSSKFDRCLLVNEYQAAIALLRDIQPDLYLVEEDDAFSYANMLGMIRAHNDKCKLAVVGLGNSDAILHAFRLGAFDYLTKAKLSTEMDGCLRRFLQAAESIPHSTLETHLGVLQQQLKLVLHRKFFEEALRDKDGLELLVDKDFQRSEYGISFDAPNYTAMSIHLSEFPIRDPFTVAPKIQNAIKHLDPILLNHAIEVVYYVVPRGTIIILNHDSPLGDAFFQKVFSHLGQTEICLDDGLKLTLGVSATTSNIQELGLLVEQAKCASDDRFFHQERHVFYYNEQPRMPLLLSPKQEATDVLLPEQIDRLQALAFALNESQLCTYINRLLIESESGQIFVMRSVVVNNLLIRIFNDLRPDTIILGRSLSISKNPPPMPEDYDTMDDVIAAITHWIELRIHDILQDYEIKNNPAVLSAQYYIENHYMRDITLDEISSYVHLNPSYFSTIFREHTGKRFLEYLRDYRLSQAIELLNSTNRRISDIASSVGIQNVNYFSKEFTKKYHMTPTEYRRQHYGT